MGACCSRRDDEDAARFRYIDGRRYHNISNSEYILANDEVEAERLIRYHEAMKNIWGGLFRSPVEEKLKCGAKVIDVGCGTGTWLLDMARTYPESYFVGIDFSPIFPTEGLPENLKFVNCNFLDGLLFEDSYFDFTHQKFMCVAYTDEQWEKNVIPELLRITKSGGWIEFAEADSLTSTGKATQRIMNGLKGYYESKGLNCNLKEYIHQLLKSTNAFSEIRTEQKSITLGKKGGKSGQETLKFYMRGLSTSRNIMSSFMNITPEHFDALAETVFIEAEKCDTYSLQYRIYGHKL
ncbi:9606_t:CDS:2 [Ambispora leptoticha]|uniref:9606_t:CDS:1 n=1 Tax=Ambispora leptoticha TaxID=144679 RepID=A0A9N9BR18_9GLOM|nr:9606_t:CDS:2 [Ambispora leptoticha]